MLAAVATALAAGNLVAAQHSEAPNIGGSLPASSALPFIGILLSIALLPLLAPKFWHRYFPQVAAGWALVLLLPFVMSYGASALLALAHTAIVDYLPFVVLIGTLYTIGGGVLLRGSLRGSPWTNAAILAAGTALASLIGTTGAAMVLIRPLLRATRERRHRAHTVVFFIFLVANIGGTLTPLGDPPLFLGFLHGVPFFWTLALWRETLLVASLVLGAFLVLDLFLWRRESPAVRAHPPAPAEPLRLQGWHNLFFLGGVLLAVVASGVWRPGEVTVLGVHQGVQNLARDSFLVLMLAGSWLTTKRNIRRENHFTWEPVREVAILFGGIFVTIIPFLAMLRAGEHGALRALVGGVRTPAHYFWACGLLSSFLDNAPTYLAFLSSAIGRLHPWLIEREAIARLLADSHPYLQAIATGAVFMGASTYIGNAPNFMVKAIAEEQGVRMPSFVGYIARYSLPFLLPVFLLVTWLFF